MSDVEPALCRARVLLVGASPLALAPEDLARLAAQCDVILALDGGATACEAADVRLAAAIGDFDSLDRVTLRTLGKSGVRVLEHPPDKDVSDLVLGLEMCRNSRAREVVVTGVFGGRIDQTLATVGELARYADLLPVIVGPDLRGWMLSPLGRATVTFVAQDARISLLACTEDTFVTSRGVRWPLTNHRLGLLSSLGISNEAVDAEVQIDVSGGCCLVLVEET